MSDRPIFDCDVHETLASTGDLVAYLDEVWHDYRPQIPSDPYRVPVHAGGVPYVKADYEQVRDSHLDARNVGRAVLTGATFPGTAYTQVEYHAALTTAYNTWLADTWLERDDRLLGSIQVVPSRPEQAALEIERAAADPRMVQVVLPVISDEGLGLPRYRPIFEAAASHDLVVALRLSPLTRTAAGYPATYTEWRAGVPQAFMSQLMNLIVSGLFDEHPNLRLLLLECGFSWLPYLMWTMDSNYKALRSEVPWLQRKPSEYVGHFAFGTHPLAEMSPPEVERVIDMVGSDAFLLYASHAPHRDQDAPDLLDGWADGLRAKVLRENGEALYAKRLSRAAAEAAP